jgi:uncharacterized protein
MSEISNSEKMLCSERSCTMLCKNFEHCCWMSRLSERDRSLRSISLTLKQIGNHSMQMSKYNIISKIKDSNHYYIVNTLSGQADILEPANGKALMEGTIPDRDAFIANGYLVEPVEEKKLFDKKYREHLEHRENEEIQLFFVPWYSCNFDCTYCYQSSYESKQSPITTSIIDAFFKYAKDTFSKRKYYITLFGGEPLLAGAYARSMTEYFLKSAAQQNISVAIVTNGYTLEEYVPLLSQSPIREVQVTLDGTREIHNTRRPLKGNKKGTFDSIVTGIDAALASGLKINFRVVVDKENVSDLPSLAVFAKERGWTKNKNFKTQLGRNYELHSCNAQPDKLFTRIGLYEAIYTLSKDHPEVLEFHKPAYSVSRFLWENGSLPDPLFDACPGCKSEWAFDYTGGIYSCTATVGKNDEQFGTFYPEIHLDESNVVLWKKRDITTINKCTTCSVSLACGGGCASVAKNQHGSVNSHDCRPIKELLELGISNYFENEVTDV